MEQAPRTVAKTLYVRGHLSEPVPCIHSLGVKSTLGVKRMRTVLFLTSLVILNPATLLAQVPASRSVLTPAETAAKIDQLFEATWKANSVEPAPKSTDEEFVRRLYLDLAGRIPSVAEAREFFDADDAGFEDGARFGPRLLGEACAPTQDEASEKACPRRSGGAPKVHQSFSTLVFALAAALAWSRRCCSARGRPVAATAVARRRPRSGTIRARRAERLKWVMCDRPPRRRFGDERGSLPPGVARPPRRRPINGSPECRLRSTAPSRRSSCSS